MSSPAPSDNDRVASSSRPKALFLSDSEDEADTATKSKPSDVDALFDDLDADDNAPPVTTDEEDMDDLAYKPLAPALDLQAIRKKAEARQAKNAPVYESSPPPAPIDVNEKKGKKQDTEKKDRKKVTRLDEDMLLGPTGFPMLIKQTKDFKLKGKGREEEDLKRLLQLYQFWTHKMHPKMQFRDTVERIEKLSHSKRMTVALSVWRDQAHGIIRPEADSGEDVIDLVGDEGEDGDHPREGDVGSDRPMDDIRSSSPEQRPPSSAHEVPDDDDDFDVDAIIRQMEEERLQRPSTEPSMQGREDTGTEDVHSALGHHDTNNDQREGTDDAPRNDSGMDDEEMWDLVRELENEASSKAAGAPMTDEEEWEDMYA